MGCPKPHYHIEACNPGKNGGIGGLVIVLVIIAIIVSHVHAIENAVIGIIEIFAWIIGSIITGAIIFLIMRIARRDKQMIVQPKKQPIKVTAMRINELPEVNEMHRAIESKPSGTYINGIPLEEYLNGKRIRK